MHSTARVGDHADSTKTNNQLYARDTTLAVAREAVAPIIIAAGVGRYGVFETVCAQALTDPLA